jgi:hypothetical protein
MNADTLNLAGEALKALGEEGVIASFHAAGRYFTEDRYGITLHLEGTPGIHGSGTTLAEAFSNALRQREEDAARLDREARIRAMVEAEEATEQRRAA